MTQSRHVIRRGARYHYRRRVPTQLREVVGKEHVGLSLETSDEAIALAKAREIDKQLDAEWRDLRAAKAANAYRKHDALKRIAESQGFNYRSGSELAEDGPTTEILRRLAYLERITPKGQKTGEDIEAAVLGLSDPPKLRVSNICDTYFALTPDHVAGKNARQTKHWRNVREKPTREFLEVVGDKPLADLVKADFLKFREFQWARVEKGEISTETANKQIHTLVAMLREIERKNDLELPKLERLAFRAEESKKRENIPVETLRALLEPRMLDGLNAEARRLFIVCMFTGARPSEIAGLDRDEIRLDEDVPHIVIRANANRALKNRHSERRIPLVSGALKAMQAQPEGFPRYRRSTDPTAAINKHFRLHKLLPEAVTMYGARHAFSDLLLEITSDERMRCELMGHAYRVQQAYGKGFTLAAKRDVLAQLPFPTPEQV